LVCDWAMTSRISTLFPLFIITLYCIGIVECGYLALEYFVLPEKLRPDFIQPASPEASSTDTAVPGRTAYQVILARNLFAAVTGGEVARPAARANLESMDASHLDILLLGTVDDREGGNRAVILDKKTSKQRIHRQGEEIEGAVIKEIRRGKVILAVKGKEAILDMSEAAKQRPLVAARIGDDNRPASADGAAARPEINTGEQVRVEEAVLLPSAGESTSLQKASDRIFRPKITRPGKNTETQ
jgi:hypothetical protein